MNDLKEMQCTLRLRLKYLSEKNIEAIDSEDYEAHNYWKEESNHCRKQLQQVVCQMKKLEQP